MVTDTVPKGGYAPSLFTISDGNYTFTVEKRGGLRHRNVGTYPLGGSNSGLR